MSRERKRDSVCVREREEWESGHVRERWGGERERREDN
jgi:hypothetical protein